MDPVYTILLCFCTITCVLFLASGGREILYQWCAKKLHEWLNKSERDTPDQ
ncbi:DUF1378 family protein [Escherichia coli]